MKRFYLLPKFYILIQGPYILRMECWMELGMQMPGMHVPGSSLQKSSIMDNYNKGKKTSFNELRT
jgi:hypothetical protein